MPTHKRILIVSRRPPYGSSRAAEMIELILMMGAFDLQVSLLFMDDGVYQLLRKQSPDPLGIQNMSTAFAVMPQYGIDTLLVAEDSLRQRNLTAADLVAPVRLLSDTSLQELFLSQDALIEG